LGDFGIQSLTLFFLKYYLLSDINALPSPIPRMCSMSFLDLIFSSAFDVHELSLPLAPSRWEGGPRGGIFLFFGKNDK